MKIEKTETGKYFIDISDYAQMFIEAENVFEARDKMINRLNELINDYIEEELG